MPRPHDHKESDGSGRRCYAVVLFADLCDYTPLVERIDPEEANDLTSQLLELATRIIGKHGGTVNQAYGDGVLAIFGYPTPKEDDARRAVEAALELHAQMRTVSWHSAAGQLRLHSGIDSGLVFVRNGNALRGQYEVTGDAFNTSARLCAAASRDEILISDTALSGIEAFFSHDSQRLLTLKGKRLPMRVCRVTGHSGVSTRLEARTKSGMTTFVGREHELERLHQCLKETRRGTPAIALVTGAPGIGKSRLLAQFAAQAIAGGAHVLRGGCESYGDVAPLQPFVQVLRHIFGLQQSNLAIEDATQFVTERTRALGAAASEHLETYLQLLSLRPWSADTTEQQAMIRALAQLVWLMAAESSVVMMLDDWQWADDTSRKVLDAICRGFAGGRLCLIVGFRAGERIDPILEQAQALPLAPFSRAESVRMICELRPRVLDLGITDVVHHRSGGNPLFLEELCRSLSDDGLTAARTLVPTTLHGMIQARLSQVSATQARVLQVASVIGNEFSEELLIEVLDRPEGREQLAQIARGDLVYETERAGVYRFKHGIAREVLYDSVRKAERCRVHRAIAAAIERAITSGGSATEQYEALAYHYRGSDEHELAATYAELAGDKAMLTSSLDRARLQYSTALAELAKLPMGSDHKRRWLAIGNKWAGVYVYSPSRQQIEILQQAANYAAELGDRGAQAYIANWRGWSHFVLGDVGEAKIHTRQGLEFAQACSDPRILVQLWSTLGQCHVVAGEHAEALECLGRGIELKRARTQGRKGRVLAQGFAYGLSCRAILHALRGEFELAEIDIIEALDLVRSSGHPIEGSVFGNNCIVKLQRGEWEAAMASAERCCEIGEQVNAAYVFAIGKALGAFAGWNLGGTAASLRQLRQAVDWLQELDTALWSSLNYGFLAEAYATTGQLDEARHFAERALGRAQQQDPLGEAMAYRVLARLAERTSQAPSEFVRLALESAMLRQSRREAALNRLLVAELRTTPLADAVRAGTDALAEFESMGMRWHAEEARRALSSLTSMAAEPERGDSPGGAPRCLVGDHQGTYALHAGLRE